MNTKETLKKLHKAFPTLTLDDLFTILDCYVEEVKWNTTIPSTPYTKFDHMWFSSPEYRKHYDTTITANDSSCNCTCDSTIR